MPQMRAVMSGASEYFAPAQERFKEPRRFVDPELRVHDLPVGDLDEDRPFAFHARQRDRP